MKKLVSLFISAVMVIGILPSSALAIDYEKDQNREETYINLYGSSDYSIKYFYDDDYFRNSAYEYNASLSTMSLITSLASTSVSYGDDYTNSYATIKQLMTDIGMENFTANEWYSRKPDTDSIAVACSSKKIDDFTLVAISVRGGGYGSEWASNFTMGSNGNHEGFQKACDDVLSFTDAFLSDNKIEGNVKFWITGYSRAAATANLIGGELDDGYDFSAAINYDNDGVYAYCFEVPCGALKSTNDNAIEVVDKMNTSIYFNIFNIINPNDLVCYVAPTADEFGFGRFGVDIYLPSAESSPDYFELRQRMLNVYYSLPGKNVYTLDNFVSKTILLDMNSISNMTAGNNTTNELDSMSFDDTSSYGQRVFMKEFMDDFAVGYVGDRASYVNDYQDEFRTLFAIVLGSSEEQTAAFYESFQKGLNDNLVKILTSYFYNQSSFSFLGGGSDSSENIVGEIMLQAVKDANIQGFDDETVKSTGKVMLDMIMFNIMNNSDGFITLIDSVDKIAQAHDSMLCLAWLESMDSNYFYAVMNHTNNGDYRMVKIYGANGYEVTDSSGKTVAQFSNGKKVSIPGSGYQYGVDGEELVAFLPVTEKYDIKITEKSTNANISIIIAEYSAFANSYTRVVNYQGDLNGATIPAYTNNEVANYTPKGSYADYKYQGNGMIFVNDFRGDHIDRAYRTVTVSSQSMLGGSAIGSGTYMYGEVAYIEARANKGYGVDKWTINNKDSGSDSSMSMIVTDDMDISVSYKFTGFSCSHSTTTLKNVVVQTCDTNGYTGDYCCTGCGETIKLGTTYVASGHYYIDGFCSYCSAPEDNYVPLTEFKLFDEEQAALDAWIAEQEALKAEQEALEEEESEEVEEEIVEEEKEKEDKSSNKKSTNYFVPIVICSVLGVAAVTSGVVAIVLVRKKKKS